MKPIYVDANTYPNAYLVLLEQSSKQVYNFTTGQLVTINAAHYADHYAADPSDATDGLGLACFEMPADLPDGHWLALIRNNASPAATDPAVKAVAFDRAADRQWRNLPELRVY